MIEVISTILEAMSGFIVGRFNASNSTAQHFSRICLAAVIGLAFFSAFGIYEFISPAPNPMGNIWLGLFTIALCVSIISYAILLIDYYIKKKGK